MKLWRLDKATGKYVVLSDSEIRASINPTRSSLLPGTLRQDLIEARKEYGVLGFCLLAAWMIFGFCVSMITLAAAAFTFLIIVPYQIITWIMGLLR